MLIGGTKLTQERVYPELKQALELVAKETGESRPTHDAYTKHWETNGFTIQAGSGVDARLNSALAIRVASLDYSHSWTNEPNGINHKNSLQFTSGLVLRMGTW